MKLVVCAKSDGGTFIGLPSASGYTLFTADDRDAVQPGDILANPTWDEESVPAPNVKNLTTGELVKVRLVKWGMTLPESMAAMDSLDASALSWHPPWPGI